MNVLWALEGVLHKRAHNGVLFTYHKFSLRTFKGVFSSSALRRTKAKMMALEGLFRKLEALRDSILCRMVALRMLRGGGRPRNGCAVVRAPPCVRHHHGTPLLSPPHPPHGLGLTTGQHGSLWTLQMVKAIIKCSGELQNDLCGKRLVGNFLEWCDTPLIKKLGFSAAGWVLVVRRDRGGRPFRGASRG